MRKRSVVRIYVTQLGDGVKGPREWRGFSASLPGGKRLWEWIRLPGGEGLWKKWSRRDKDGDGSQIDRSSSGAGRCMSHNTAEVTMLYVVHSGQEFACPVCGTRYVLYGEDPNLTPIVVMLDGHICAHLDLEILPTSRGGWEIYFDE